MPRTTVLSIFMLLQCLKTTANLQLSHIYYNLQDAQWAQKSKSIVDINKCKKFCLEMKTFFPFRFRYHRLIYRQNNSYLKYFTGHCQLKLNPSGIDFVEWPALKKQIEQISSKEGQGFKKQGLMQIWQNYCEVCETGKFKLSQQSFKALKLQRVHSNFVYNDDSSFQNLQPFTDISKMLQQIKNARK